MRQIEISFTSITNELIKLNARLEKKLADLEKKTAKAEKLGVANMTVEEHREWLRNVPTEEGWIVNKEDINKNGAWFDLQRVKDDIDEIRFKIERTEKKLEELAGKVEEVKAQEEAEEELKRKAEAYKKEFEEEVKEWAKDGITLLGRYYGNTPKGKRFYIHGNWGWTDRSRHCVTLIIDGDCIFTSGEFWRAYAYIMKG